MDLMTIPTKSLVYVEESVLQTSAFVPLLQGLIEQSNPSRSNHDLSMQGVAFVVETNIRKSVEHQLSRGHIKEAYLLDGLLDLLLQYQVLQFVDTKNSLDLTLVAKLAKERNRPLVLLTQKESVFQVWSQDPHAKAKFCSIVNGAFASWEKTVIASGKAFYVADDHYLNQPDLSRIDYVYSPKYGHLRIVPEPLHNGYEGYLYQTYQHLIVKVYRPDHIKYTNFKKISRMLEMDFFNPFINWPKDLVYVGNDFAGYVMEEIKGAVTLESLRIDGFSKYSIVDRYRLCYNLVKNIDYLHQKNILFGDVKLDNILIRNPSEVFLVDMGSCQIDDYACGVFHPDYTIRIYSPEELKMQLRMRDDEYYPVNKILFEVLVGKNPNYNRHSAMVDNDNKFQFYYPLDVRSLSIQVAPYDMQLWMAMSPRIREMFYYYFKEGKITPLPEWIDELQRYIDAANRAKEKR